MKQHNVIDSLIALAAHDRDLVIVTTDVAESTKAARFGREYPAQFVQCGRSDAHAVLVAVGLAHAGKKPVLVTYAANTLRALEQLSLAAQNGVSLTVLATHAGLSSGQEGASTQTLHDISHWKSVPALNVIVPVDDVEARKALLASLMQRGTTVIRLPRTTPPLVTLEKTAFHPGKTTVLRAGADCTLIACGQMVALALSAAERLAKLDIGCTVLNSHTLAPFDKHGIFSSALQTGCAVTIEEHSVSGGLGSSVAELLAGENVPLEIIGLPDTFGESGTPAELTGRFGLTVEHVILSAKNAIARKCKATCTALHEQHAQFLVPPAPEQHFRMQGGGVIRTIPELASALPSMDDSTYIHHASRGDFSAWVSGVFKQKELAQLISGKKNKLAMACTIARWLR